MLEVRADAFGVLVLAIEAEGVEEVRAEPVIPIQAELDCGRASGQEHREDEGGDCRN
jgi:hypothetical protein